MKTFRFKNHNFYFQFVFLNCIMLLVKIIWSCMCIQLVMQVKFPFEQLLIIQCFTPFRQYFRKQYHFSKMNFLLKWVSLHFCDDTVLVQGHTNLKQIRRAKYDFSLFHFSSTRYQHKNKIHFHSSATATSSIPFLHSILF